MANDKTFPEVKTNPLTEAAKKRLFSFHDVRTW